MIWLKTIILGIIEGLTEFLPISSTGHLIIFNDFLELKGNFANLFAIVIQSGAILAVIVYFFKRFIPKSFKKEDIIEYITFWMKVVVGILPIGIIGILFKDFIKEKLFNTTFVAIMLIVGAICIILIENMKVKVRVDSDKKMSFVDALKVGFFQTLAILPGMSRSASTIIGSRLFGFSRSFAAEFSFYLAVPVLLGATIVELFDASFEITSTQYYQLGLGTVVSFVTAYFVIGLFMNYIKKHDFKVFAYYRIVLGVILLIGVYLF